MRTPPAERLTRREREIMNALFARANRASAEEIREQLTNPPGYSAVRAMLVRLEQKGHVRHHADGLRYIYSATTSPAAASRAAFRQYLRVFFGGSLGHMMTALLRQEDWTDSELDTMHAEIDRIREERKQG
jgi:BlaI family penicillinase repressor